MQVPSQTSLCYGSQSEVSTYSPRGSLIVPHFALWVMPSPYQGVCGMAGGVLAVVSQVVPV